MDDLHTQINMKCLFCQSDQFDLPSEGYQPVSGDQLLCANCGRTNDYDSLLRVAKKRGVEWAEQEAKKLMEKEAKKIQQELNRMFK